MSVQATKEPVAVPTVYAPLDKHFKCPKAIKIMMAGRPKSEWKGMFDAHQSYVGQKKRAASRRDASAQEAPTSPNITRS